MKTKSTLFVSLLLLSTTVMAQNQITTPTGQPLIIGNQGVKLSNLNSSTATQPSNNKVLTVDANGLLFLAPDVSGGASQWTNNAANIFFSTGNVGVGTNLPLQRLDVNGDINIPTGNALRINNLPFLKAPGTGNAILGQNAGNNITTGGYNVIIGSEAGYGNSGPLTGSGNAFIGYRAGYNNTAGQNNFYFGNQAGFTNTTGQYNVLVGSFAGGNATSASYMTAMGFEAGKNSNGPQNFFLGYQAGKGNDAATNNGSGNIFMGYQAGLVNEGSQNIFIGNAAGKNNIGGFNNIFIGSNTGTNLTTSASYNNILIGFGSQIGPGNLKNSMAIGVNSQVDISNAIILGATGANQPRVGIGNASPTARFHITAGGTTATGVRFEGLPTATGSLFNVYVDSNGNMMRASTANAREAFIDTHWALTVDEHLINNNSGGIIIGAGMESTPAGYKLFVSDGILTEKVKVAIKNTSEWRDNVFFDTYQLKPIEEVEAFIKANHHLPGVPTAQEMVANGNDLQKTDAMLLEKVEELMLYVIELKKENISLKSSLIEIKKQLDKK